jgi:hypothetical protein
LQRVVRLRRVALARSQVVGDTLVLGARRRGALVGVERDDSGCTVAPSPRARGERGGERMG